MGESKSSDASIEKVRAYYASFDEWARLDTPAGQLEFERTLRLLECLLPPGAEVLDLGGGPGRYAIELARNGHRVAVADLSRTLLDEARRRIDEAGLADRVSVTEVDGVELKAFDNASFDAVLAFGPFYHLVDPADRTTLAHEIARVVRSRAIVAVAFLPRLSGVAGLIARAARDPGQVLPGTLTRALESGVFVNGTSSGFQEGWYGEPAELTAHLESAGLRKRELVSIKGLAASHEAELLSLRDAAPELFEEAMAVLARTEARPEVVALGDHALWIGEKHEP